MKRVAGYVRVSRVGARSGDSFQSPKAQEEAIRAHALARRLRVVDVVHELDQSGGSMQRPQLQRLIQKVENGEIDGIVVARLDRFSRTLLGGIDTLEQIHAAGGFVQTVEGGIDTSTAGGAMGELQLNLLLSLAQWERATRAEGFEAAKKRAVDRGVHISGRVPTGYVRAGRGAGLELDPVKASAVHDAFQLRASGASFGAVMQLLDDRLPGGPSGNGAWNRNTVTRLLSNRAYLGEARQGRHVHPGAHLPIVAVETFDTVQALRTRREKGGNAPRSLLAGLAKCGSCGYALDRNTVGKRYKVYRCRGRSASGVCEAPTSAMADTLDALVTEQALARLEAAAVEAVEAPDDVDEIHRRLAAARAKRLPFEDPGYVAVLGVEAAEMRALTKLDDEIAVIESEIVAALDETSAAQHPVLGLQRVREVWPTLSTDRATAGARRRDHERPSLTRRHSIRSPHRSSRDRLEGCRSRPRSRPSRDSAKVEPRMAAA